MAVTQSVQLTQQFYDWEIRGRGWHYEPYTVDLEPPFFPFFGHFVPAAYTDDGKRPTLLSKLIDEIKGVKDPVFAIPSPPPIDLIPFEEVSELAGYAISFSKQSKPSIDLMEQCLVMLSGIHEPISFEVIADSNRITLQLVFRDSYERFVYSQLKAFFPDASIVPMEDVQNLIDPDLCLYTVDYGLQEEYMRPLNTPHGGTDTLLGFWGVCEQLRHDERVVLQVLFNGIINTWADNMQWAVSDGGKGSFFIDAPEMPTLTKEKCSKPLFAVALRILTQDNTEHDTIALLEKVSYTITQASTSAHNALFPVTVVGYTIDQRLSDITLRQSHRSGMLLNSRELTTFVHFPAISVAKKLLGQQRTTKAAPYDLIDEEYVLGTNTHQGISEEVGIDTAQRVRHMHIIGATGVGKSTLLQALIMQDVERHIGCCVIDPHGDVIDTILDYIPEDRIQDVVLIDPSDGAYPIGLNILLAHSDVEKELLASDLVALFKRFSTSWGDQMNSVFANAISAFVYNTHIGTLGDLRKFLIEQTFRTTILSTCTDPDIVYYWHKEYPILKNSSVGSILTRLDSFLRPKVIRTMVCQNESLNFREIMDSNKIMLVKLSQGLLGEENSYLLGSFIVSKLQQIAMSRQAQSASERVPFFCYIDECQHFITPSMNSILSGGRKFALGLILVHQDMHQLIAADTTIANSIIANAGTRIVFRVGDTDAKRLQEGFTGFSAEDLQNLSIGEAIVRVNTAEQDFNITVQRYEPNDTNYKEDIIDSSRALYSTAIKSPEPPPTQPAPPHPKPVPPPTPTPPVSPPIIDEQSKSEIREHRYLQTFLKKMAEEHGYKATIEVPIKDGQIDVLLEKGTDTIAVEISITTTPQWELHNIKKCLVSGYSTVVVVATTRTKIDQIKKLVQEQLTLQEQANISVITKEEIPTLFIDTPRPTETVHKGYRVKVKYEETQGNKSDIIQRIISHAKKG